MRILFSSFARTLPENRRENSTQEGEKLHLKEKCRPDFKNTELGRDLLL
jgi:hypothetical protein